MDKLIEKLLAIPFSTRVIMEYVLLGVGLFLLLVGYFSYDIVFFMGIVVLALMLIYCLLAFRCPHCDAILGDRMVRYSHCPKCGKRLEK